eukprot:gene14865-19981_t
MDSSRDDIFGNNFNSTTNKQDKFQFHIDTLLDFLFPPSIQHSLVAGRLIAFGLCGPLVNGRIITGKKGNRFLADYELDEMCLQFEREDIVKVYLHKSRDFGLLTKDQQEALIAQADPKMKKCKGKGYMPQLSKQEVIQLFEKLPADENGCISFHEAQKAIVKFRDDRIKQFKQVFPDNNRTILPKLNKSINNDTKLSDTKLRLQATVSDEVAPVTMFRKMEGYTNPDLIELTTKTLGKHGFKIIEVGKKSSQEMTSNIKLLREAPPFCKDTRLYKDVLPEWNTVGNLEGANAGSFVNSNSHNSICKRKYTLY